MNTKKIIEPFFNPAMEILPLLLFMIVGYFFPLNEAFLVGIASYVIYFILSLLFSRVSPPYMLIITGITIIIFFLVSITQPFSTINPRYSIILCEIIFVFLLSLLRPFKNYFSRKIKMRQKKVNRAPMLARFDEFIFVSRLIQNALIAHLLIVLLYEILPIFYHTIDRDNIIIPGILLASTSVIIIYELIRVVILWKKIRMEDWLPIVNEAGSVIGKVAFSVSQTSRKAFLHPIVRIALIHKGLLYLCERPDNYVINPNKVDYPFEKFVFYEEKLEDAIENALGKNSESKKLPVKFVFRYLYKNNITNRLIYLYTCKIDSEETMHKLQLKGGKLWTEKQIEENLGKNVFSDCFEKEYEILKDTVLMVEKMILS